MSKLPSSCALRPAQPARTRRVVVQSSALFSVLDMNLLLVRSSSSSPRHFLGAVAFVVVAGVVAGVVAVILVWIHVASIVCWLVDPAGAFVSFPIL